MITRAIRRSIFCALLLGLTLVSGAASAAGAPDMTIERIDASAVTCGTGSCGGRVSVEVANKGRALQGGYNIFVELKVYEQGQGQRARTYKEKLFNFPGESSKSVSFDGIQVLRCNRPHVFEAKVYVVGGNFREGNTRNNDLKVTSSVRQECRPGSEGVPGSTPSPSAYGSRQSAPASNGGTSAGTSTSTATSARTSAAPDLLIPSIRPNVTCGNGCRGSVEVEVKNAGRAIQGGINIFVELKVYEQGEGQRAKTYKEQAFNFPGESSKSFTFDRVEIQRCGRPYVFEAKVYAVGGSFREGNTRNNDHKLTETVRRSCR